MSATTILSWDVRMWRPIGALGTWRGRNHVQQKMMKPLSRTWMWRCTGFYVLIWPESLLLLVSYLKGGILKSLTTSKMKIMLDCTGISLKTGGGDFRISSVNKPLCGELLNISFSISKMQMLDMRCLFHCNTSKAAGLHSSKWCPSLGVLRDTVKSGTRDLTWWDYCRGGW